MGRVEWVAVVHRGRGTHRAAGAPERRWGNAAPPARHASPIRPPAVAAADSGLLAPELAAGIGLREAPAILLGRGRRRSAGAARNDGPRPVAAWPVARTAYRAAYGDGRRGCWRRNSRLQSVVA
jgi:hypothetical protein